MSIHSYIGIVKCSQHLSARTSLQSPVARAQNVGPPFDEPGGKGHGVEPVGASHSVRRLWIVATEASGGEGLFLQRRGVKGGLLSKRPTKHHVPKLSWSASGTPANSRSVARAKRAPSRSHAPIAIPTPFRDRDGGGRKPKKSARGGTPWSFQSTSLPGESQSREPWAWVDTPRWGRGP